VLIPKASHLVERVAERLLRSGALDASTAQLLRSPGGGSPKDSICSDSRKLATAGQDASAPSSPIVTPPAQRSSLFAPMPSPVPPPSATRPDAPLSDGVPSEPLIASVASDGVSQSGPSAPQEDDGTVPASALASPDQSLQSGTTAVQSEATNPPGDPLSHMPSGRQALPANPAAAVLQGPATVDAASLERAGMIDWSRTRSRISEEFRLVQRQIIRSAFGPGAEPGFSNLLLVTSARPGEGKSFISANLAGTVARQGDNHVLWIDADSKRSSVCYSLGLAQAPGLLDLAADSKLDPAPLIVKTPIDRLSILPVGRDRERSAELFSTKEMTRLIQSLGRRYADRLLILDAPPCLSTSDPAVLAQVVGQILFVVEADRTQREEIEASLDLIQACPTITMVLNKQQGSSRYTFGARSSYYAP
jgi:protein-tyrosine kinase